METKSSLKLILVKPGVQGEEVNSKAGTWIAISGFPFCSDDHTVSSLHVAQILEFLL